jgi:hypothetical protein
MNRQIVSNYRKLKLIKQGEEKRKAQFAQIVYITSVGKANNGRMKYVSETKHEFQHFVE